MAFKALTPNNWDRLDETNANFVRHSPIAGFVPMNGNDWARAFLAVELTNEVPGEIRDLFAVARGALLYGWFFYPLFRLGEDQLHRVAEAAAARRYHDLGGPEQEPRFARTIDWLVKHGAIPAEEKERWHAARELRNIGSHPKQQWQVPPGQALSILTVTAEAVNALFTPRAGIEPAGP
ncbi:MAG: DUF4145 domain-containing protein [Actinomycetota bacterium]|nr:DUF4145 domain-containing protein [Actinomycetota bacterium]